MPPASHSPAATPGGAKGDNSTINGSTSTQGERVRVIREGVASYLPDIDPDETHEWLESFDGLLDRSGPGLQQVAYRVTDVDAVCAVLRDRGLRLLYPEPKRGTAGSRINFVHPKDAGGVLVELVEPARP